MAQARTVSADAASGPQESTPHSDSDLVDTSTGGSFTEQWVQRFIADETRTTVSFNTVEHKARIAGVEAAEKRMTKELQDFDAAFQKTPSTSKGKKQSSKKTAKRS